MVFPGGVISYIAYGVSRSSLQLHDCELKVRLQIDRAT